MVARGKHNKTAARTTLNAQRRQRSDRAAKLDNAARDATFGLLFNAHGVGYKAIKTPIMFDCTFTQQPLFTSGVAVDRLADKNHYRYPVCNVGVYKWVSEPNPTAKSQAAAAVQLLQTGASTTAQAKPGAVNDLDNSAFYDDSELLYTGAYIYIVIAISPVLDVRTDGSNLADLETQLGETSDPTQEAKLQNLIAEATEALYLIAHPPSAAVTFSLCFKGVALKGLPQGVMDNLNSDPAAAPVTTPVISATLTPTDDDDSDDDEETPDDSD